MITYKVNSDDLTSLVSQNAFSQEILIGSLLAITGNLLISLSLNIQRYIHKKNADLEVSIHYLKRPVWWMGLLLMGVGEIGNFTAYGFAPASLVAPLGTTTVIANMFIAVLFLREKLRSEDIFGTALAVIGTFLLVIFAPKTEKKISGSEIVFLIQQTPFILYLCIEIIILLLLLFIWKRYKVTNILVYIIITNVFASFTIISAKAVSSMIQLSIEGINQFTEPMLYVMVLVLIVTVILQINFLNKAMKMYESTVVVPTNFVFFTISAIVSGIIFYKEFLGMKLVSIIMFLLGCIMCFSSVYFITIGRVAQIRGRGSSTMKTDILPEWLNSTIRKFSSAASTEFIPDALSYQTPVTTPDHSSDDDDVKAVQPLLKRII